MKNIIIFSEWIVKSYIKIAIAFVLVYLSVSLLKTISPNEEKIKSDSIPITNLREW